MCVYAALPVVVVVVVVVVGGGGGDKRERVCEREGGKLE